MDASAAMLSGRRRQLRQQGELTRGVLTLVAGTTLAQGIAVGTSPIITRLFLPSDLGTLAVFTSILSLLLTLTCLSYDFAIPLPEADVDGANVAVLCLLLTTVMSLVVGVALLLLGPSIFAIVGAPGLGPNGALLVLAQFFGGFLIAFDHWAIRGRRFGALAATTVVQSGALAGTQIALGIAGAGAIGLLMADVTSRLAAALSLGQDALRHQAAPFRRVSRTGIWRAAVRYRRFPILSTPSALLNTLGLQAPTLLIVSLYGTEVGGQLFLAQRVAALPMTLVARSVGQVYFSEAARITRDEPTQLKSLFRRTTYRLARLGAAPTLVVMIASPILFPIAFGQVWQQAGWFAAILAPMYLMTLVTSPTGATLDVLERQDLHLTRELLRFCLVAGAVITAAALQMPPIGAVTVLSIAGCITYCLYGFLSWRAIVAQQASPPKSPIPR